MNPMLEDRVKKTILFEKDLYQKVQAMADENQRDFSKQVRYMLMEYIRLKEQLGK